MDVSPQQATAYIVNPLNGRKVEFGRLFLTHPPMEERIARPGAPRRDWQQSQKADGHVIVRHPDWDETLRMAKAAATDIRIYAQ